jgi:hypothetical protein
MRAPIASGPEPMGSPKTRMPPMMFGQVRGDRGEGDDLDARSELEAARRRVEGDRRRDERRRGPRAAQPVQRAVGVGEVLDGNVGDAEQRPGGHAQRESLGLQDAPVKGDRQERGADREDPALDGDQRGQRRVLRPVCAAAGQSDDRQPGGCDGDAEPLPSPEAKAEEPLGEDGQEDQPAGEHGLDDRQRCPGKCADVQHPRQDCDQPPDREPLGAKERGGTAKRMADFDRSRDDGAAVLQQEGHVGGQRGRER